MPSKPWLTPLLFVCSIQAIDRDSSLTIVYTQTASPKEHRCRSSPEESSACSYRASLPPPTRKSAVAGVYAANSRS